MAGEVTDLVPSANVIEAAVSSALQSPCQSKRGAVLFRGLNVYSRGHNRQVSPFVCDGSGRCKASCRHTAVHAEQMALLGCGDLSGGMDILHVKVLGGVLVPSGPPSCTQCSKLIVESGLVCGVWLFHADGWRRYGVTEFHMLSVQAMPMVGP